MSLSCQKGACISKYLLIAALILAIRFPALVRSQEDMSSESAMPNFDTKQAEINEGVETGSSLSEWWLNLFLGSPGENSDPTHVEKFEGDSEPQNEEINPNLTPIEEVSPEETQEIEGTASTFVPLPSPPLKTRRYGIEVISDPKAKHSCVAEILRADVTDQRFIYRKLILESSPGFSYSLEVGSLPDGIDVVFSENKIHLLHSDIPLTEATVEITSQEGARKGDFAVPIIFIQRGQEDSAFICQLNIVNR